MARKNNLPTRWVEIARKHREKIPAGAPFSEFQTAMRAASAEYHHRPTASNPSGGGELVKWALIAGLAYVGYKALVKPKG